MGANPDDSFGSLTGPSILTDPVIGGVTSSLEYPAVCVPAGTASLAEVLAFGDLLDDLGSDRSFWKLSSGRVCCSVGSLVGWVGACGLVRGVKLQESAGFWASSGTMSSPIDPCPRLPMLAFVIRLML